MAEEIEDRTVPINNKPKGRSFLANKDIF